MALIGIFLLGFLEISLPLPIVIAMDGGIELAFLVIAVSGSLGCLFFIYLSQPIRRWVVGRYGMGSVVIRRTERFMIQYGVLGVGLLAPMILGHAITAVGAVVLGTPTGKLAFWMIVGVWLWTIIYYVIFLMGGSLIAWTG